MRVGSSGSSSASTSAAAEAQRAQEAAEAQRRAAEEAARRAAAQAAADAAAKAEAARSEVAQTSKKANETNGQLKDVTSELSQERSELERKSELLGQKGGRMPQAAREKLTQEVDQHREKVTLLQKEASALEKRSNILRDKAIKSSNEAISAEKAANEAARAAGKKEPYALANQVKDVFDAGSLSAKDQTKLLGEESVVTPQEAARFDATRVAAATEGDVANGAKTLEKQLAASKDPAYREALIKEARPSIEEMGRQISLDDGRPSEDTMKATLASLSRAGELGGREGAQTLADSFARHIPDHDLDIDDENRLGGALKDVLASGNGASFAAGLADSLQRTGKGEAAEEVSKLTREALEDARNNFEDKQEKVDELNGELGRYISGFGPSMTKEQQQKAIESFRERHAEEYQEWEEAGGKYASMLEGASAAMTNPPTGEEHTVSAGRGGTFTVQSEGQKLQEEAKKALEHLPEIGQTKAGLEQIANAVAKQGKGEETFLDSAKDVASTVSDTKGYLDKVSSLVVKGTALKAMDLASSGKTAEMKSLMSGLEKNSALLGVDSQQLKGLTQLMGEFKPGMTHEQLKTLGGHIDEQISKMSVSAGLDPNGPTAQAFKGLGVVMGGISTVQGIKDWSKADFSEKISTLGNALNVGADGGSLALDVFGKAESMAGASKFLKVAGPVGAMASALGDGLGAVNAFKEGKYAEGIASGATAVGAALMAVPSGVTQVIGGALVIGGAIANYFIGKGEEHADEDDLKAFLEAGGINPSVADAINDLNGDRQNYGDVLKDTAQSLGTTQAELLKHMASWNDDQLGDFQKLLGWFGDRDEPEQSGQALAALMREANLAPPPLAECPTTP